MEQLITKDDLVMHEEAKFWLRTGPDYSQINNPDVYLLQFAFVLMANVKLRFQRGFSARTHLELSMPESLPGVMPYLHHEVIKDTLSKIIDERIMESFTLQISVKDGKTKIDLEVHPLA